MLRTEAHGVQEVLVEENDGRTAANPRAAQSHVSISCASNVLSTRTKNSHDIERRVQPRARGRRALSSLLVRGWQDGRLVAAAGGLARDTDLLLTRHVD
jgi:hypothetical protein